MRSFGLLSVLFLLAGAAAFSARAAADAVPIGQLAAVSGALPLGAAGLAAVPALPAMPVDSPLVAIIEPTPPTVTVPSPAPTYAEPESRWERRSSRRNRYWREMPYHPGNWAPPEGPVRIALQAGHWRAAEAPDELRGIRDNGARAAGKLEWEVNLAIAREAAVMLEAIGYEVDVLPAVVPPSYRAHLFISIHADGSNDPRASGYRVASPRRDVTGRADLIVDLLERSYGEATGLPRLPTVTRRMSNYYAFNYRRYQHALHPLTVAVILETGFLTSASDRTVIVDDPSRAARGIVAAVTAFAVTPPPVRAVEAATSEGAAEGAALEIVAPVADQGAAGGTTSHTSDPGQPS